MIDTDQLVAPAALLHFGTQIMSAIGCSPAVAQEVAEHLVDADLHGVYSHGIFRLLTYAERARAGKYDPAGEAFITQAEGGAPLVNGGRGLGISALRMATDLAIATAKKERVAAVGVCEVDHTGRLGAFAKKAADAGCLAIIFGGGARKECPQVAAYGGARAALPTNPYAFGIPGGERGPVVIDFATSSAAGGKIYAAKEAGRALEPGLCIDAQGRPTTNPDDCLNGGALLPMAGPKGYGMALMAELLGESIYGEAMWGLNWICICVDLSRFRAPSAYTRAAEECLAELRSSQPAPGFERVEIPGEREQALFEKRSLTGIPIPVATLHSLRRLGESYGVDASGL